MSADQLDKDLSDLAEVLHAEESAELINTARTERKRLLAVVRELQSQRGRLEQMEEDFSPGLPEYRLAQDLLDALDQYEQTP